MNLWKKTLQNLHLHYHQNHQHFCVSAALGQAEGKTMMRADHQLPFSRTLGQELKQKTLTPAADHQGLQQKEKEMGFCRISHHRGVIVSPGYPQRPHRNAELPTSSPATKKATRSSKMIHEGSAKALTKCLILCTYQVQQPQGFILKRNAEAQMYFLSRHPIFKSTQ